MAELIRNEGIPIYVQIRESMTRGNYGWRPETQVRSSLQSRNWLQSLKVSR